MIQWVCGDCGDTSPTDTIACIQCGSLRPILAEYREVTGPNVRRRPLAALAAHAAAWAVLIFCVPRGWVIGIALALAALGGFLARGKV